MKQSEQIDRLAEALSQAQGEIQNVVKDAKNPHYKSEYATLDAVTDTVRPVFAKHGLAVLQAPAFADGIVTVETLLTHSSGQWVAFFPAAPLAKLDAQGVGSATTYLRRYSLAGLAAIAQTDDDGNLASQQPRGATIASPNRPTFVPENEPPADAPAGYDDWLTGMGDTADKGMEALTKAFAESKEPYRRHLTGTAPKVWAALRTKAGKVAK